MLARSRRIPQPAAVHSPGRSPAVRPQSRTEPGRPHRRITDRAPGQPGHIAARLLPRASGGADPKHSAAPRTRGGGAEKNKARQLTFHESRHFRALINKQAPGQTRSASLGGSAPRRAAKGRSAAAAPAEAAAGEAATPASLGAPARPPRCPSAEQSLPGRRAGGEPRAI